MQLSALYCIKTGAKVQIGAAFRLGHEDIVLPPSTARFLRRKGLLDDNWELTPAGHAALVEFVGRPDLTCSRVSSEFVKNIRELMLAQKMNQNAVAAKLGISRSSLSHMLNADNLTFASMVRLAQAVNAEVRIVISPK